MSLNYKEIELILNEIDLKDSFLREVYQSNFNTFIFSLRKKNDNFFLKITLNSNKIRFSRIENKLKKLEVPQRFTQFLRSNILSFKIKSTAQINNQRIIKLILEKENKILHLYIKLWTSASNIILCSKDDLIIDVFSRRPTQKEIKGQIFQIPEQNKTNSNYLIRKFENDIDKTPFYKKIEQEYIELEKKEEIQKIKNSLIIFYKRRVQSTKLKLQKLDDKEKDRYKVQEYKEIGNILKNYIYQYKNKKDLSEVKLYNLKDELQKIKLDKNKTFIENIELYFKRAKKIENSFLYIQDERERLETLIKNSQEILEKVEEKENINFLKEKEKQIKKFNKNNKQSETIGIEYISNGFLIIIGRSADENEEIFKRRVRGNDLWLHTREYPGSYVFIKVQKNKSVPLKVLLDAGNLAIFYSKAKDNGSANLHYTYVKYLKKPKGAKKGLIIPTNEKNLYVKLEENRIKTLRKSSL